MKRSALALVICLVFACVGYPQDLGQSGAASEPRVPHVVNVMKQAKLIHYVKPKYPKDAKNARVSGTVVLKVLIGKDGTVWDLKYVSGPNMLVDSAMNAVKKWRYEPTLLNGKPVQVDSTISVVYSLPSR